LCFFFLQPNKQHYPVLMCFRFCQRVAFALRAISVRLSEVIDFARAVPSFKPPFRKEAF
jgi:hypothetical protein